MVLLRADVATAPYSMNFWTRVLRDAHAGLASKEVAANYSLSRVWVDRVSRRGNKRSFGDATLDTRQERLVVLITATPNATLVELSEALRTAAAVSTLCCAIDRPGPGGYKNGSRRPDTRLMRASLNSSDGPERVCQLESGGIAEDHSH
jgi:hypothetical protein